FPAVSQGMYLLKTSSFSYEEKSSGLSVEDVNVTYSTTVQLRTGGPTWQNFASAYIGNQCLSCHRPDSQTAVNPYLRDYDEVIDTGSSSNARIQNDTMPPGNPSLAIHKRQFQLWRSENY